MARLYFCCILKKFHRSPVSNFKPKSVFIHTGHINYRRFQTIYTVALIFLAKYLYMMLSERKLLPICSLLWITQINEERHGCSFKTYSHVSEKYLITLFPFACFQLTSIIWVSGVSKKGEMKVKSRSYWFKEVMFSSQMSNLYLLKKTVRCKCSSVRMYFKNFACFNHVSRRQQLNLEWACIYEIRWSLIASLFY